MLISEQIKIMDREELINTFRLIHGTINIFIKNINEFFLYPYYCGHIEFKFIWSGIGKGYILSDSRNNKGDNYED